jgi:hypothetical protein
MNLGNRIKMPRLSEVKSMESVLDLNIPLEKLLDALHRRRGLMSKISSYHLSGFCV